MLLGGAAAGSPVLHAAAGLHALHLGSDPGMAAFGDLVQVHERCVTCAPSQELRLMPKVSTVHLMARPRHTDMHGACNVAWRWCRCTPGRIAVCNLPPSAHAPMVSVMLLAIPRFLRRICNSLAPAKPTPMPRRPTAQDTSAAAPLPLGGEEEVLDMVRRCCGGL